MTKMTVCVLYWGQKGIDITPPPPKKERKQYEHIILLYMIVIIWFDNVYKLLTISCSRS